MNFPNTNWDQINAGTKSDSTSIQNKQINELIDLMDDHLLVQLVKQCTTNDNILDYYNTLSECMIIYDHIWSYMIIYAHIR